MSKDRRTSAILLKRFKGNHNTAFSDGVSSSSSAVSVALGAGVTEEGDNSIESIEEIKALVQNAVELIGQNSTDRSKSMEGLQGLRKLLGSSVAAIEVVVYAGLVPILSNFLIAPSQEMQIEAAWCLTNIASGDTSQTSTVLNAVPSLVQLLSSDPVQNRELHNQVVWCLGNMAGDTDTTRQALVAAGAIPALAFVLFANAEMLLKETDADNYIQAIDTTSVIAAWALSNVSRGSTPFAAFTISSDNGTTIVTSLLALLNRAVALLMQKSIQLGVDSNAPTLKTCLELVEEVSWVFTFLSRKEAPAEISSLILQHDLGVTLCNVCDLYAPGHPSSLPAIRALGNLTSGPIEWLEYLMPSNLSISTSSSSSSTPPPLIITTITKSLASGSSGHRAVLKEGLWVTANLLGGTEAHRDMTIKSPHLMEIISSFLLCDQFDLQREAIFATGNSYKNNDFLLYICSRREILVKLIELLNAPDPEVVIFCMSILRDVALIAGAVEVCTELGMMDVLDEIQYRSGNEDVRRLASGLTDEIFAEDEEDINGDHSADNDYHNNGDNPSVIRGNRDAVKPAWMSAEMGNNTGAGTNVFKF